MSDSNSGNPGSPYGGPPPSQNPYGQPPGQPSPYGEQPAQQSPQHNPYGQPGQPPYGEQPAQQSPQHNPYGQPSQPPYGQQPHAYGGPSSDKRPGTVTAAAVITLILSGLSLLVYAFVMIALLVAKDEVLDAITDEPGFEDLGISADSAFGVIVAFVAVFLVWSLIACILAVMVLRRSNAARIALVVSSAVTAVFSLLGIGSGVSAITLLAGVAVIVLLFTGGANAWFKGKARQSVPGATPY